IEMNNFYTVTVYNKGAEVIRMQETLLGKAGFKRGMDLYFSRHDGEAVTCDDFVNAMSDANGVDLEQFRLWYSQDGTPIVSAEDHYNPDTQTYTLTLHQECPDSATQKNKKPFHIPVKVGLLDQNGQELNAELLGKHATTHVLELRKPSETFTFHSVKTKPIPSLLRDFSAPVKLNYPYTEAQLLFLFSHDSNEFNRWNAGQQLFTRKILEQVECILEKQPLTLPSQYVQAISKILESDCDTALIAEAVMLPSEQALSETMRIIHVDALHQARLFNVNTLATELKNHWLNIYQTHDEAVFSVTPSSIAKRRFKNVALSYLARLDTPEVIQLIDQQFKTAHNMTDQLSALGLLLNCSNAPIRESALLEFYTRFKDDALVMDKWLALQALADRPDTPERVAQLLSHPTFNIKNPNKVYALLGSFTRNAAHFHRADGAGYELIYSAIETLNPINPQVTARLVRSFMNFKRYEPALSQKMRQILERLMQKSLCKDAYEIVTKALG
ncbi:MAG: DUF3458 domain-containing protein, partial [Gammaproteobacteria bacterium]|nr:DUF3458 domain-containing protein [Gammaproteobacteria bacterium]